VLPDALVERNTECCLFFTGTENVLIPRIFIYVTLNPRRPSAFGTYQYAMDQLAIENDYVSRERRIMNEGEGGEESIVLLNNKKTLGSVPNLII
jgi:hypothetical protein